MPAHVLRVDIWPANVANGARPVALRLDVYRDVGSHAGASAGYVCGHVATPATTVSASLAGAGASVYAEVRLGAVLKQLRPVGPDIGESGDELLRCRGGRLVQAGCRL